MKHIQQEINIKTTGASNHIAKLTTYIPDVAEPKCMSRVRPAVLILPGGGYEHLSPREGEPVAMKFLTQGLCAFVLEYSVAPARFPQALCEAAMAIKYIRENAADWHIDPNKIAICGFSAGGHLAASLGVSWNAEWLKDYIDVDRSMIKPNLMLLSYPVITSGEFAHKGSIANLLGDNNNEEMMTRISLEKQVTKDVPPTFLWHTYEDRSVPVKNSMLFANALLEMNIPLEMHIYRRGGHGLSLGNFMVNDNLEYGVEHMSSDWIDKAIRFIYEEEV